MIKRAGIKLVDVTGIEPVTPCLQSRPGKILAALSGVAYTETDKILALSNVPKLYRELNCVLAGRFRFSCLIIYGVGSGNEPPKMSLLPKVAGQSCSGAGWATEPPDCTEARQLSTAGQSAAFRTSFQTAAP